MSPRSMRLASATSSLGGEQRHAPDRAQVEAQRVEARLDRQVELARLGGRGDRRGLGGLELAGLLGADQLDAVLLEVRVELGDLLARQLGLLERRGDAPRS